MSKRAYMASFLFMLCAGITGLVWYASYRPSDGSELRRLALWQSITVFDAGAYHVSDDSNLDDVPHAEIPSEATEMIVKNVTYHRGECLWKGRFLGEVALVDGRTERIAISYYGGFFKIVGQGGYYQTHGRSREQLEEVLKAILVEEFIPKREARNQPTN